jgi:hypothetical protein
MIRLSIILLLLSGCASTPYVEMRMAYQIDPWSDWVLQPERKWTPAESEVRIHLQAGLEFDKNVDCYVDSMIVGPWSQAFVGCSKRFGSGFFVTPKLMYQVDDLTSDFLNTDQKQWQGPNPFLHLRVGYQINPAFAVGLSTGKSLFQGAPFEKEEHNPDLYWTNVDVTARLWGKHGLFSKEHLGL